MSSENIIESLISKEEKQCFMSNFSTLREAACRYQWGRGFSVWGEVIAEDNVTSDGELLGWVICLSCETADPFKKIPTEDDLCCICGLMA